MTIASKTLLQQMRFVRCGAPFCSIAAKTTVDAENFDYYDKGGSFYGPSNETTPFYQDYAISPVRRGAPNKVVALRQIAYGGVRQGDAIYSYDVVPSYTPYQQHGVRQGAAFKWITAKNTIDASSDYYQNGSPFYVYYDGAPPPVTFNASQFFIMF